MEGAIFICEGMVLICELFALWKSLMLKCSIGAMMFGERTINGEIAKGRIAIESVIVSGVRAADIGLHTGEKSFVFEAQRYSHHTDVRRSLFGLRGSHIC